VELLSNLAWVAVSIALWVVWIGCRRRTHRHSLIPELGLQLVALGILTAILLPVISVSDDLQACHNPAEVEHPCGKSDHDLSAGHAPCRLPVALASTAASLMPSRPRTLAFLSASDATPLRETSPFRALWSKPPPVV
jgi:hypothetical protein